MKKNYFKSYIKKMKKLSMIFFKYYSNIYLLRSGEVELSRFIDVS